jgi:membrane protease YdiL (CAAX protease family)
MVEHQPGLMLFLYALLFVVPRLLHSPADLERAANLFDTSPSLRKPAFLRTSVRLAGTSFVALVLLLALRIPLSEVGLQLPAWDPYVWSFVAGWLLYLLYRYHRIRRAVATSDRIPVELGNMRALAPHRPADLLPSLLGSISAAIFEEFLFRGYLLYTLATLFHQRYATLGVVIGALIFGLAHRYQGWRAARQIALYALAWGVILLLDRSLLAPILLHAAINLSTLRVWLLIHPVEGPEVPKPAEPSA